ncbi:hypothetical protein [Zooshikella harenae]|uniref:DUF2528 family protein n=1 Tax=Zooshikella harenae TaxID=2827238 RepID=A0ABS5ZKK2_9GAMM|nr:hypothetical protein [Zooshikella harenae]MBU2714433.1 hypothetical protein [Zooshikella harenae]
MDINWIWVPNKSIGCFYFDQKIDVKSLPFQCEEVKSSDESGEWSTFEIIGDASRFSVENNILISVECVNNFVYKGINLIGISLENFLDLFDDEFVTVDNWDDGKELCCRELGIIVWIEEGLVESISVSS